MKVVSMSGSLRENVGKKDARKVRNNGGVPCVIYGGKEQIHFSTDSKSFLQIVFTPEVCFVKIDVDGKEYNTILQDIQYHPVTDIVYHADFMEFSDDKPIVMNVPVKISGVAPGILKGGKLVQKFRKLKVKALPGDMPENIDININSLEIGMVIKVADITSDKYTILDNKNNMIIGVSVTRAVEEAAATAAAAPGAAKAEEKK
ncbi:MAG: 50S ribosomal protein L25/general stress protein Ctc [Bacteroidota bacterium]